MALKIVPDLKELLRKIHFSMNFSATRNETNARQALYSTPVSATLSFHFSL
jgi:hypothetical protein